MCYPGPLPFFRGSLHLGLFQCPDNLVYDQGAYNKEDSLAELTPITYDQGHLLLVIRGDSGKLNPDKNISEGLHIVTPTTAYWNPTTVSVKVIDGAHFETTLSDKWGGNRIHPGAIINGGSDQLTIHKDLANIFRSQPPVPGILVPVAAGSIPASSYFWATARVALGTWPPFTPVPMVWFNPFFSANAAFLSFSAIKANFRAGFNGFLHSRQGWPSSLQL